MAVTTLDPRTALIVVDLQAGIVRLPAAHPIADVLAHARMLLDAFRAHALPVVLVKVAGDAPGRTEQPPRSAEALAAMFSEAAMAFVPELGQQESDIVVTKRSWGAFANTGLAAELRARGVSQVVVCGVATSIGVDATARQAYELGLNVTLAIDAMTAMQREAHDYSIQHVFPRLGETGTAQEIVALLGARSV